MLAALRLSLLILALPLLFTGVAEAKTLTVPAPAEGQVSVVVGAGAKRLTVRSAPPGLTVAGGVKRGRFAVAVVRPRAAAGSGKVALTVAGAVKGVKRF